MKDDMKQDYTGAQGVKINQTITMDRTMWEYETSKYKETNQKNSIKGKKNWKQMIFKNKRISFFQEPGTLIKKLNMYKFWAEF